MPKPKKVVFYSNFLNDHQLPFCLAMKELLGDGFVFVATERSDGAGVSAGITDLSKNIDFCLCSYESPENEKEALRLAAESDVVIFGSAPEVYFRESLKNATGNKLVFRYSERLFKPMYGRCIKRDVCFAINAIRYRFKNYYLLSAGAYSAADFHKLFMPKNKMFKWGYFPDVGGKSEKELLKLKGGERPQMLWAGRMIDWKHPEYAVMLADKLKRAGYDFFLKLIGSECEYDKVVALSKELDVTDRVEFLGSVPRNRVIEEMEKSKIFLFTSNKNEGWGAVLSEAMASGCACVSDRKIGAAQYLIEDGRNGFTYNDFDELVTKTKVLLDDPEGTKKMGEAAKRTMDEEWNAENAARKLVGLCEAITERRPQDITKQGVCSRSEIIKD